MTRANLLALSFSGASVAAIALLGATPVTLSALAGIFVALLADGVASPASGLLVPTRSHGSRSGRRVALTFDDGPDPEITPRIADALAAAAAKATFFCIGRHVEAHPDLVRRLVAEGHELGNHSYAHSRLLNFRGPRHMDAEIARGARAIQAATGPSDPLYRPPLGLRNYALSVVAARRRLTVVNWSLHGRDTGGATATQIAARVLSRARPGDIILLHDGCDREGADRRPTAEALPAILAGLEKRGLVCVTASELLHPEVAP